MFGIWINMVRESLGPAPRQFPPDVQRYLAPPIPWWTKHVQNEPLLQQYQNHGFLFGTGNVGWGVLVQANEDLFEPGDEKAMPAVALFSPDEYYDEVPLELRRVAHHLFDQRESPEDDPELREFARQLNHERGRYGRRQIPGALVGGRQVFMADVMVHREHLPRGVLEDYLFPLLHHPETWTVWIVPDRFWPEEFTEEWGTFEDEL